MDYSGTLGGKNKWNELKSYCDASGIMLAPSFDLMNYERSGNGYTKTGASSIAITKAYATQAFTNWRSVLRTTHAQAGTFSHRLSMREFTAR